MKFLSFTKYSRPNPDSSVKFPRLLAVLSIVVLSAISASAKLDPEITLSDDQTTLIVQDAPDQEVIAIGKSVIVNKRAKGVLAIGGDVVIDGRVDGDVAAVGGNVVQKKNAYIGGDIIVFGGAYKPEDEAPLRETGKMTVSFGVFEEEFRNLGQNPSQIFAPSLTAAFFAQRLVLALFWFVLTFVFTTLAPGAVGRAAARIQLSWLKVAAVGSAVCVLTMIMVIGSAMVLPNYLGATVGAMGVVILLLAYVFGRVALQVSTGKLLQKYFLDGNNRSETLAILIGVVLWTILLSLPFVWVIALFAVFVIGAGLVLTGRPSRPLTAV